MRVSLIVPAYNEEKRLGPFLQSIVNYLPSHPEDIQEVIVVDDGSNDATAEVANNFISKLPQLRYVCHQNNRGKGAAVQTGVMAAAADYIIFMDADGATAITELPKMLAALEQADIGVGNRWMTGSQTLRHSSLRQLAGWAYRVYMGLFGLSAIDTMCGFKGYRKDVARELFSNLIEKRWLFDAEVAYKAVRRGLTIKNFPIAWESKDGSKLDLPALLKSALQIWPLLQRISYQESEKAKTYQR